MPSGMFVSVSPKRGGVPIGGTTGQVLTKLGNEDWNSGWLNAAGGGGVSSFAQLSGTLSLSQTSMSTSRLLGRASAGTGTFEEIILGTNLSFTGTTLNAAGGGANGADPVASVGLTTVVGSAITFLRSDGAPPIDQSITPTWTGLHAHRVTDAGTNTTIDTIVLDRESSGTPANGLGGDINFKLESNTTSSRQAGRIAWSWTDVTDATRTSKIEIRPVSSGALITGIQLFGTGGCSLGSATDPGGGIFNASSGLRIGNADLNFSHLAGNIVQNQMNNGTGASSTTFWRGDNTWSVPPAGATIPSTTIVLKGDNLGNAIAATPDVDYASAIVTQDVGDTNATISAGVDVVRLTTTLTANRVLTLPAASGYNAQNQIYIIDPSSVCTGAFFVSVARAGSDTINGGTSNVQIFTVSNTGGNCSIISDGTSKWNTTVFGGKSFFNGNVNALSPASGKILQGNGSNFIASTPTYPLTAGTTGNVLTSDGTNWLSSVPAGGGNVSATGTPSANQIAQWTSATVIQGITPTSPLLAGAGSLSLNVGVDHAFTATQTIKIQDAATNVSATPLTIGHNSSGTPTTNFGTKIVYLAESDTIVDRTLSEILGRWTVATDATRTSQLILRPVLNGSAVDTMTLFGSGGVSVNASVDPGAGIINANSGFKLANAEFPIAANGLVKRTAANTYAAATAGTDYVSTIPIANTLYVDTAGNDGTAVRGRLDKPYLTILAAVTAASAGDVVLVGPGTFTQTTVVQLPANVSLYGAGMGVTTLVNSTTAIGSTHAALVPGSGSVIKDITVDSSGVTPSAPIGCLSGDTAFTSAFLYRVKLKGDSDGFYFDKAGATGFVAYDCITSVSSTTNSADSAITISSTGTFDFYNCKFSTASTSLASRGITCGNGTVRVFGGTISATGSATANQCAKCTAGTLELHEARINRDATGNDLFQSGGTLAVENVTRDDGAALTNSGTITQLSRYALRDNNLSDLPTPATARTNLGATTVGGNFFTLTNPGVITFPRIDAANTVTARSAANFKSDLSLVSSDVGLGSVTNDAQTKAAIVPNTAPAAGQILVGNAGGTAYAPVTVAGSGATITVASTGVHTISGIANASLTNSAITIAGTSTDLGGSITVDTIDSGISTVGLIKRTGANTRAIAVAGTDFLNAVTAPITNTSGNVGLNVSVDYLFTAAQSVTLNDATTNGPATVLNLNHDTTGTPANGIGTRVNLAAETSTNTDVSMGDLTYIWTDVTHATRTSRFDIRAVGSGTSGTAASFFANGIGPGSMSVGATTNPGASGIINANTGFRVTNAASSRKILAGDGTNFIPSTETWAVPGSAGNILVSDGTNWTAVMPASMLLYVKNITNLTAGCPADIATITIPAGVTRWRALGIAGNITGTAILTESQTGTPAAGTIAIFTATGGGGSQITVTSAPSNGAGTLTGVASNITALTTGNTLTVRQMANSAFSAVLSFYIAIVPYP